MDDLPKWFNKDEYWHNMTTISNLLVEDDVEKIKYLNSHIDGLENVTSTLELISSLEQHSVVGFDNLSKFKEQLCLIGRIDLVECLYEKTSNALLKDTGIYRIFHGLIVVFILPNDEKCAKVEYKLNQQDWININMGKNGYQIYVVVRRKNTKLFVKIENFMLVNSKIRFKFTFQRSNESIFQVECTVVITGMWDYETNYNQLIISLPEAIDFNENIKKLDVINWQLALGIKHLEFSDENILVGAVNYIDKYYPNNDVILSNNQFGKKDNLSIVFHRFLEILHEIKYTRAVLISYPIKYYSYSFSQSFVENLRHLRFFGNENKLSVFISKYSLIIIVRIASSLEQIRAECANCLNDVISFYNINKSLIENEELNILGTVVLPVERRDLKEAIFFHFSEDFNLDRILFLCQDELNNMQEFENWWRLTIEYFHYKRNKFPICNEFLFKKLIGLAMFFMGKLDTNDASLFLTSVSEPSPQMQIKSWALNNEQINAINNNMRIKIITGIYGSGKSVVGKKLVESLMSNMSENPLTLYYICCNHFSLFECEMKEFADKVEKPPSVTVVCDNLYKLWKKMCKDKNIAETNISLPKLLEYLASIQNNKICFVLEELSDECVNEKDAKHLKKLFSSELKESKVVMITKPSGKTNYLDTLFSQKVIDMETISLNYVIRGTNYLKLFIDSAQEILIESKTFLYVPNIIADEKSEKPKVIYLPFHNLSGIQSAKVLSFVLEMFCFDIKRKTVVLCNNMEEVKSVAYAIDVMGNFKAVHYSPYLQKYSPLVEEKIGVTEAIKNNFNILVTDTKGFSGLESESVVFFLRPEEIDFQTYLDAMTRSNFSLTVVVLGSSTIINNINVLNTWSENLVQTMRIKVSNKNDQLWTKLNSYFYINDECKEFLDRGAEIDFNMYKKNKYFRISTEKNSICNNHTFGLTILKEEYTKNFQPFSEKLMSREKLLCEIRHYFLQDAKKSTLVLYGMSGVGKTHIATKYCEISYNFYKNFVWIDAAFGKLQASMRNQCQTIGFEIHDSNGDYLNIEAVVEKIHNYYKNEKTLYIFDNVDDESVKNLSMYISRKPNSFTLITSQWRMWSNNANKMLVDVFSSEEAIAYVKNNIKEYTDKNIRNLIKELGYHPFAITQAIKYINIHKISIEKYIDRYRSKPSEILNNNNFPTEEESKSAIKAINLVLIKLEKTKPFLIKILNCLSHCDGQNISKQFITQISNHMKINEEYLIDEAIELLMSYSLLNRFDDKKYSIHELTQLTCRCFQKKNSSTNTYVDLIESYFKVNLNKIKDHMDYGDHFVFHFIYMFRTNKKKFSKTFHHMTTPIEKLLVSKGLFEEAIEILIAIQNFNTETYGEKNELTLHTKHNIANCLSDMGKYNEALEIYFSVNKIQTEILGTNHPSTMTTKYNIANCFYDMGKYNEALEIYYSVDKMQTEILGINHPDTMVTKHNIASCLNKMGKYNEALEIYYSVDKIQTEILGINHPSTMTTKYNIANCFYDMGKYNEALEIYYSVDKMQTEILGINHPDTMVTKHNIASCLNKMGKYNEALEIYYSVDKIQTEILGINHPSTMTTKYNIANCFYDMGKYNEALEIYYSVDKIQTEILGINHPDTMVTKHNIASCLNKMGKYNETLEIYLSVEKIQTEILGINHPDTMATKHNIANCLNYMGKYNETLEIYYSVDKIQTEILGINHPDTMVTKHNIASCLNKMGNICLNNMGKYNEALAVYFSLD
ncbi:uncharacterized protein LOC136089508 [Hydra vulgaris]|uniref:Uncharacterized protein LOC136089508 n=1 Tax=Hydra vulgaris TaxID=6087 RepID=A0ABM4DB83_HYDVU